MSIEEYFISDNRTEITNFVQLERILSNVLFTNVLNTYTKKFMSELETIRNVDLEVPKTLKCKQEWLFQDDKPSDFCKVEFNRRLGVYDLAVTT